MSWLVRLVLVVVGIVAVVVGIIYLVEPIHSLPSFFPGSCPPWAGPPSHPRNTSRSCVGVILLILAGITRRSRRRSAYRT